MTVKRIVPDIFADPTDEVVRFYRDLFDLKLVMDQGWIATLASESPTTPQISIAARGGSGAPVPNLSIEVDDIDAAYRRATTMGIAIAYDLTEEPWGVRRFFVHHPAGNLLNVLAHTETH